MLTNVYVDAFNLYYGLGHYLSHPVRMPLAHPPSTGPHTVEVIRTEEKGSDVNLASYLLLDGFRSDCEATVVISNDSDLKVPIELARAELGLVVGVVNPLRQLGGAGPCSRPFGDPTPRERSGSHGAGDDCGSKCSEARRWRASAPPPKR
jgi:hypothetical protein